MQPTTLPVDEAASDADLLAVVAGPDRAAATAAQAKLYDRHVRYLWGVTRRVERKILALSGLGPEDLVQETFQRAFDRAKTFVADDSLDADRARQRVRAWLGRIATNLLSDYARRVREVSASPTLERLPDEEFERPVQSSRRAEVVTGCLDRLSEREQDVVRVTALYLRAGASQRLPNAVSAELAARWETTNDNVRAIRKRALGKLEKCIKEHDDS